jgi:hypothetical protein
MGDSEKINLFISYAHADAHSAAFDDFRKYIIEADQFSEYINPWIDGEIQLGAKWNEDIMQNLAKADIVILVISQAFLNSKYIKNELKVAFEKETEGRCKVIPLFFESLSLTDDYKFLENQGYPSGPNKIKDFTETKRGKAFSEFQGKILAQAIQIISNRKKSKAERTLDQDRNSPERLQQEPNIPERANQPNHIQNDCKFYAIIIVNYDYEFLPEKNILNIKTNLTSLKKNFTNNFKIPEENIVVLENNTSAELYEKLGGLTRNCSKDSTLFVYYSGHGIPDSEDFYWATKNTKYEDKTNVINTGTAFEASRIKKFIEKSPALNKILVCDCCYAEELLVGKQFINIEGYMKQKVELNNTFYLFSSEAKMESFYPVNEPGKSTYFTDAFVRAFEEELNFGNNEITIGNIYERTAKIIKEAYSIENPIPTPIRQPNDHSLDSIELFKNPNKLSKSAIESEKGRAFEIAGNAYTPNIVDEAFDKEGKELIERIEKANLSDEEREKIAIENIKLVEIRAAHSEINSIQDMKEKAVQQAKLAKEASGFPRVFSALIRQSQAQSNDLNRAAVPK